MTVLYYFINFFVLLLAGGIVINGWYAVTRGNWKDEVDGTRTKEGMLLKSWRFFWFKEVGVYDIVVRGDEFWRLTRQFQSQPALAKFEMKFDVGNGLTANEGILDQDSKALIKDMYQVEVRERDSSGGNRRLIFFNKTEPKYRFPEWLRTMMAGCVTCFSSFYGSIVFWLFIYFFGTQFIWDVTTHRYALLFTTWIAYMLSLAYVNTYLWRKTNK